MSTGGADSQHLFVFGFGYSSKAFADRLIAKGAKVSATCRSRVKQEALLSQGIDAHLFSREVPLNNAGLDALRAAKKLLSSVPPDADGDPVIDLHRQDIVDAGPFDWIGYLSTTGVYGDHAGAWVDENTPLTPSGTRGQRRVDAESAWFDLGAAGPVHTFRLAGIYGPYRNALETVRSGRARRVVKQGQVFSRIHLDDIVSILEASMAFPNAGAAYNCCDDEAAPPQDVIAFACRLLGVPIPPDIPFESATLSDMARSFYSDNKRVSNTRIKEELGVTLAWPTYKDALRALHKDLSSTPAP